MAFEKEFDEIRLDIQKERYAAVAPAVDKIISECGRDLPTMLKCASLLKSIDNEDKCQEIVDEVIDSVPEDRESRYEIAIAIRSLGRGEEAYELMKGMKDDASKKSEIARTLTTIGEYEEALALMQTIGRLSLKDRFLLCDILCSVGEYGKALDEAQNIIDECGCSYDTMANICSVMIRMGHNKEAVKYARSQLKDDKKSADSLALAAYVMWINGKTPAAANFANRALQKDYGHIGALEIMAMCLVEKKKYPQAKLLAGAINEKDPANPAVIRILDACRDASRA